MSEHREHLAAVLGEDLMRDIETSTSCTRGLIAVRVNILVFCLRHPEWRELTAVQVLADDSGLGDYDSDTNRVVSKLFNKASHNYDSGCSSDHHDFLRYTYHVAMYCAEIERDSARRAKVETLARLEQQRAELMRELGEEVAP